MIISIILVILLILFFFWAIQSHKQIRNEAFENDSLSELIKKFTGIDVSSEDQNRLFKLIQMKYPTITEEEYNKEINENGYAMGIYNIFMKIHNENNKQKSK
jgi:hypothetical protein